MKNIIMIIALTGILSGYNTNDYPRGAGKIASGKEPQYIRNQRLESKSEKEVNPYGAEGAGYGFSYASRSYGQSAVKNPKNSPEGFNQTKHCFFNQVKHCTLGNNTNGNVD